MNSSVQTKTAIIIYIVALILGLISWNNLYLLRIIFVCLAVIAIIINLTED